jgi:hypothetical protein
MEVGLCSMVLGYPVLILAPWVGTFRAAFLPLSSSLLCSALGSPGPGWGFPPPQAPLSALIASHRLSRVLAGGFVHLPRVNPQLPWALLASLR